MPVTHQHQAHCNSSRRSAWHSKKTAGDLAVHRLRIAQAQEGLASQGCLCQGPRTDPRCLWHCACQGVYLRDWELLRGSLPAHPLQSRPLLAESLPPQTPAAIAKGRQYQGHSLYIIPLSGIMRQKLYRAQICSLRPSSGSTPIHPEHLIFPLSYNRSMHPFNVHSPDKPRSQITLPIAFFPGCHIPRQWRVT